MSVNPRYKEGNAKRKHTIAALAMEGRPCWICGLPIDYSLPHGSPLSYECDELVPISKGGSPVAYDNLAAAHACCNNWRKDRPVSSVELIKKAARRRYKGWTSPTDFVKKAKTIRGAKPLVTAVHPKHTTDW